MPQGRNHESRHLVVLVCIHLERLLPPLTCGTNDTEEGITSLKTDEGGAVIAIGAGQKIYRAPLQAQQSWVSHTSASRFTALCAPSLQKLIRGLVLTLLSITSC